MSHAFKTKLPTMQKLVLIVLCDGVSEDGVSRGSIFKLVHKTSMAEEEIVEFVKALSGCGVGIIAKRPLARRTLLKKGGQHEITKKRSYDLYYHNIMRCQ